MRNENWELPSLDTLKTGFMSVDFESDVDQTGGRKSQEKEKRAMEPQS